MAQSALATTENSNPHTGRVLVALGALALVGTVAGVAIAMNEPKKDGKTSPTPTPQGAMWKPVSLSPFVASPTGMAFVLGPGEYRLSIDRVEPRSPEELAMMDAWAQSIPANQENHLVTYEEPPSNLARPSDWPADDLGANRIRSSFVIPQGQTAAIPPAFNDRIWVKAS